MRVPTRHSALLLASFLLGVAGSGPELAHAEPAPPAPLEIRVNYHAPPGCPSGADFLRLLHRHVAAGGEGAIDADVSLEGPNASGFELTLRLRVAGKQTESVTRDESCETLIRAAALNASMARTTRRTPAEAHLEADGSPVLEPVAELRLDATARDERLLVDGVGALESAAPGAGRALSDTRTRAFLLGEARVATGMLPRPAWGQGASLGVSHNLWSLRLSGTWWRGQRQAFYPDGTSPLVVAFEQRSLELTPCVGRSLSRWVRVEGCAWLAGHRLDADLDGVHWAGSLGAGALAALMPWRGLRVEVHGGLLLAFDTPRVEVENMIELYRSAPWQPTARLAIGWEFGDGER